MGSLCCCADAESIRVFILDWRCFGISKVQHQLNEEINDKEIRLIGEGGEQMGLCPVKKPCASRRSTGWIW